MLATKRSASVTPNENGRSHKHAGYTEASGATLASKSKADVTRSPKTVNPQKLLMSSMYVQKYKVGP